MTKRFLAAIALMIVAGFTFTAYMYSVALRDPVVRTDSVKIAGWPGGVSPVRVLIASDLHVAGPDMPPSRVAKLVDQMNTLKPDVVLFAGDFVSDKAVATHIYEGMEALAPLGKLVAPMGKIAVLGNHDHERDTSGMEDALKAGGFTVLDNEAVMAGPLLVGGVDDNFSGRDDVPKMLADMAQLKGVPFIVSHSPDIVPELPKEVRLVAAGHTHCGQILFPGLDAVSSVSRYGQRFACGKIVEGDRIIYVGAGLGTSILPLRLGAVPDLWLVTVGP